MNGKQHRVELLAIWLGYGVGTLLWAGLVLFARDESPGRFIFAFGAAVANLGAVVRSLRLSQRKE
jgi:hypothetical protein